MRFTPSRSAPSLSTAAGRRLRPARLARHAAALALLAACGGGDGTTGTDPHAPAKLSIMLELHTSSANAVEARIAYARAGGERIELGRQRAMLTAATSQPLPLEIDVSACVADPAHAGGSAGCEAYVTLTLLRDETELDRRDVGPIALAPGRTVSAPVTVGVYETTQIEISPSASAALLIEPGDTVTFSARALDPSGAPVPGAVVQWESGAPIVVTVNPTSGIAVAVGLGIAPVRARSAAASAEVAVTVQPQIAATLALDPATGRIAAGESLQLTATARDKRGAAIFGRIPTFASSDASVASVSATGVVTAHALGTATIQAQLDGRTATAEVTVTSGVATTVAITSRPGTIEEGETAQLSALARDAKGNPAVAAVTWQSLAPQVASVSPTGLVTALAPGSAAIVASIPGGASDRATVTVTPATVSSVTVQLNASSIEVGELTQGVVVARDRRGKVLAGRSTAWRSSAPTIASVGATGLVTGVATGSAVISATVDGVAGQATVIVTAPTVDRVQIVPSTTTVTVGGTLQLQATPTSRGGVPLAGVPVSWSSASPAVATVSTTGLVTGVAAGATTITATAAGKSGTATLTVGVPGVQLIGVFDGLGQAPANLGAVLGTVQLMVNVADASDSRLASLSTVVDGVVQPRDYGRVLGRGNGFTTYLQPLNTAAVDQNFAALTPNGTHTITVRVQLPDGTIVTPPPIAATFANVSGFLPTVTTFNRKQGDAYPETDPHNFLLWYSGDVTLSLRALSYVPGQQPVSVSGSFLGRSFSNVLATAPGSFQIVFPEDPTSALGIANYQSPLAGDVPAISASRLADGGAWVTSVLGISSKSASGNAGMSPIRIDNQPPLKPMTFPMPAWIGGDALTHQREWVGPITDTGVDYSFFWLVAGPVLPTSPCDLTGLRDLKGGPNLPDSPTTGAYRARAVVMDRFGNRDCVDMPTAAGGTFGFDVTAPTIGFRSKPNDPDVQVYGPSAAPPAWDIVVTDASSGPAPNGVMVSLEREDAASSHCVIGTVTSPDAVCAPAPVVGSIVDATGGTGADGRYSLLVQARDVAGNVGYAPDRHSRFVYLYDTHAPTFAGNVTLTSSLAGGLSFRFGVTDNLYVARVEGIVGYAGARYTFDDSTAAPLSNPEGGPPAAVVPVVYGTGAMPRCVDGVALDAARFTATDWAGLTAPLSVPSGVISAAIPSCGPIGRGPFTPHPMPAPSASTISRSAPKSTTFYVEFEMPLTSTLTPFRYIAFFSEDAAGVRRFVDLNQRCTRTATASASVVTCFMQWIAPTNIPTGPQRIGALGIDYEWDAVTLGTTTVTIVP